MKTLAPENRKSLEKMVNDGEETINKALDALAESLRQYGFAGSLELKLIVQLVDSTFEEEYATVGRSTNLKFERL